MSNYEQPGDGVPVAPASRDRSAAAAAYPAAPPQMTGTRSHADDPREHLNLSRARSNDRSTDAD